MPTIDHHRLTSDEKRLVWSIVRRTVLYHIRVKDSTAIVTKLDEIGGLRGLLRGGPPGDTACH